MKTMLMTAVASGAAAWLLASGIAYLGIWKPNIPGIEAIAAPAFAFAITVGWLAAARRR